MKREAYKHPKMLDLSARLGICLAQAIGHVQLLVDWISDFAIQGDVGKWPNGAIARGAGWQGNPDEFIDALIASGWLDADPGYRLVLHDWPDHAERWVRLKMQKLGIAFLDCYSRSTDGSVVGSIDGSVVRSPPRDLTQTNLTQTNQDKTNLDATPALSAGFEIFWKACTPRLETGRATAEKAWMAAVAGGASPDEIIAGWKEYVASPRGCGQYARHPTTFIQGGHWTDNRAAWQNSGDDKSQKPNDLVRYQVDTNGQT